MKDEILKFLRAREPKLCALATTTPEGKPSLAIMGYAALDDLTMVLSTDNRSRKWGNLKNNKNVALVFGWTFEELNVQYEGVAEPLESGEEFKRCEELYFASHPEAVEFKGTAETVFIRVKPRWLRLSDYTVEPPRIEEMKV